LGTRISAYIDDSIIAGEDVNSCLESTALTRQILHKLGFTINSVKSQLIPSQIIVYLGFVWDTNLMKMLLPKEKVEKILNFSNFILRKNKVSIRKLARLCKL
jgi:hypothetical protein